MTLEMREACEKCLAELSHQSSEAYICSYECTFCSNCANERRNVCPNCDGELVRRPRRKAASS